MFALFSVLAGYWTMTLLKSPKEHVQHIHWLMLALVSFKSLTLFVQAIMYLVIEHQGTPHGWNWVYYTFTGMRGLLFFTVVILIGTGWSFMSTHVMLDDKTKQVLLLVIPLQVRYVPQVPQGPTADTQQLLLACRGGFLFVSGLVVSSSLWNEHSTHDQATSQRCGACVPGHSTDAPTRQLQQRTWRTLTMYDGLEESTSHIPG
jgi:hypothetical protein